jgi:enamine deaminase RidA (YjgF/YER057c/UK114 family)
MTLKCINPTDIPTPLTYSHAIVATGSRLVFIAGQVAEDREGNVVGSGDMTAQARQVLPTSDGHLLRPAPGRSK